jgi:hypothetical protein
LAKSGYYFGVGQRDHRDHAFGYTIGAGIGYKQLWPSVRLKMAWFALLSALPADQRSPAPRRVAYTT